MNRIGDLTRASRSSNSMSMIGIFLPVNKKLLTGTKLVSGGWVSYGSDDQVNLYFNALSVQYLFDTVGNGAFVIDIGTLAGLIWRQRFHHEKTARNYQTVSSVSPPTPANPKLARSASRYASFQGNVYNVINRNSQHT